MGESKDLRQKDKRWSLIQFLFKSIKSRRSFLYKIYDTNLLSQLCIKYNGDMQHEKLMSFVLFFIIIDAFQWKKIPYAALVWHHLLY